MNSTIKVTTTVLALLITGCCIDGSGDLVTEDRQVDDFRNIDIDVPGDVIIRRAETFNVSVKTDDNIIDNISTEVRSNTLYIDTDGDHHCFNPTALTIIICLPELRNINIDGSADVRIDDEFEAETMKLTVDGSGDIISESTLTTDRFVLSIDGSGDANLIVDTNELVTQIDGSGDITYSGVAVEHRIGIDGSGDIKAFDLETALTDIDVDGSGDCQVAVSDTLKVKIDGSGDVRYRGDPDVSKRISGSGTVKHVD